MYKNMSRLCVRHCSKVFKSRFKNCQAAERKVQFSEARPIKRKVRLIESRILQIFNQAESLQKRLGF